MELERIELAAVWVALMLVYLLGDVFRIFAGDFQPGEIAGQSPTQAMWLGISAIMLLPILMILASIWLPQPINRWANIVLAAFFFLFNLVGLPTYPGWYDRFLTVVGLGFNILTIWLAWRWV